MPQPREKSLTFSLKKKNPKLWALLQFVKTGVRGARVILSGDTEKVDDVLRSLALAFVEIVQAVSMRSALVTARDYFRQAAACNLALKGSAFLPETVAAPEDGRKQIIDLA